MNQPTQPMLDQAAGWFVTLASGEVTEQEQQDYQAWLNADPLHAIAWQQTQQLMGLIASIPEPSRPHITQTLQQVEKKHTRRQTLLGLFGLIGLSGLAWQGYRHSEWSADYKTEIAEHLTVDLPDGSSLTLDSQSVVDIRFTSSHRQIILRRGRILIQTAQNSAEHPAPLVVTTPHANTQALGTRFDVALNRQFTQVSVYEKAVRIDLVQHQYTLNAGKTLRFNQHEVLQQRPNELNDQAWLKGLLVANEMTLYELIPQLARYSERPIMMDPNVARLKISGTFILQQPEKTLQTLSLTLPIRLETTTDLFGRERFILQLENKKSRDKLGDKD
jgi:transmembrane sensor